ncbi:alanine racemase [Spirillospora sp. NPDC049024]
MVHVPYDKSISPSGFPVHEGVASPAIVVDLDRVERNIARMASLTASRGATIRPHAKTHKSRRIAMKQLAAGAVGLTVATLSEAAAFVEAGIEDVFVAYPVWPAGVKQNMVRWLAANTRRLRLGVDSTAGAELVGAVAKGREARVEMMIEIDCGGGRSGVRTPAESLSIARAVDAAGLSLAGIFTHGGHSYAGADTVRAAASDEVRSLAMHAETLRSQGFEVAELSAGSSPTSIRDDRLIVTEERPGTYVFNDRWQVTLESCSWDDVALSVQSTVVSVASDHVVLDAGAKVLSTDLPPVLRGYGHLPAYPEAEVSRLYDHHAILTSGGGPLPSLGEAVIVVPNHVCPVVNLADDFVAVASSEIIGRWPVDGRGLVI